ncbi:MAG: hypothetical protein ACO3DQ_08350, partial [Cephaloticoccus sp.]
VIGGNHDTAARLDAAGPVLAALDVAVLGGIPRDGGALALEQNRRLGFALLAGGIGACMLLTKINVGAFFLIAAGSWLTVNATPRLIARAGLWLSAVGSLLVPLALMQRLWPTPWVAIFAVCFASAALGLVLLLRQQQTPTFGGYAWLGFVGTAALTAKTILLLAWLRGTDLATLWYGIAIAPLQQPSAYAHAVVWPPGIAVLALALAGLAGITAGRDWPWRPHLLAGLKLAAVGALIAVTPGAINNSLTFFAFKFGLPLAWLLAVPLHAGASSPTLQARVWVAWVFVWQCLHAYPVAGSQVGWGAALGVALAASGGYEALQFFAARAGKWRTVVTGTGAVAWLAGAGVVLGTFGYVSHQRYTLSEPLGLHGAENLRLADDITATYRILNRNVRRHGDLLFSHPGMFSLNLWTERPTPTAANVTHWFSLLDDAQQQAIIDRLEADPRAVIVAQSYLINYLVHKGFPPAGPLQRYLVRNFHAVFRINTFEFWVRKGRTVAPLSIASFSDDGQLDLVTVATGEVAAVEIRGLFAPYATIARFTPTPERNWTATPLADDNPAGGESLVLTAPPTLAGTTRLQLPVDRARLPDPDLLEVVLLDRDGRKLDALLFDK